MEVEWSKKKKKAKKGGSEQRQMRGSEARMFKKGDERSNKMAKKE